LWRFRPIEYVSIGVYRFALTHKWNSRFPIILPTAGAGVLAGWRGPLIDIFHARQAGLGYTTRQLTAALSYLLGAVVLVGIRERRG